jgi:hypothetical protein
MGNNITNFVMGGKLGDFIQSLYAVKNICKQRNSKANVYMYDIGWEFGIKNTYTELYPILMQQEYINSFDILENYHLDPIQTPNQNSPIIIYDEKLVGQGYIDLGEYLRSPLLYKTCWSELYSDMYGFSIEGEYEWIKYNNFDNKLKDRILIQRKAATRTNEKFPYDQIVEQYGDSLLFISSNDNDYNEFPFKSKVDYLKLTTLDEWFTSINSCQMIIANLSAPSAIAHALDKLRIIELPFTADSYHCIGEEKHSDNIFYYLNEQYNNLI